MSTMLERMIETLKDKLPHGSGIDSDWRIEAKITDNGVLMLECHNSYHAMDVNGMYAGWVDFTAYIIPDIDYKSSGNGYTFALDDIEVNNDDITAIMSDYTDYCDNCQLDASDCTCDSQELNSNAPSLDNLDDYLSDAIYYSLEN